MIYAYTLLALATLVGNGTIWGLPLAVAATIWVARKLRDPNAHSSRIGIMVAIVVCALSSLARAPAFYMTSVPATWAIHAATLALGAVAVVVCRRPGWGGPSSLALVLALGTGIGAAVIKHSPEPRIDVFIIEQDGAAALLRHQNPYTIEYENPYTSDETRKYFGDARHSLHDYPYPPLSLLLTIPGRLLGDVRWALLAAQLAIALLLYALARRNAHAPWFALSLAALHLVHPRGPFVIEQAWSDTFSALAFVGLLYFLTTGGKIGAALSLGAFLAVKQYGVLLLPLMLKDPARRRAVPWALIIAAAITAPFVLWNPRAFVDDLLLFQLRQPFRPDAMSLTALVAWIAGWQAPGVLALLAAAAATVYAWKRVATLPSLALGAALVYLWFFLGAKQAFCNYYYFAGVLLLGSAACAAPMLSSPRDGG